ncbi:hypothetical protein VE04_01512 [Pseudogymnoascus sp. 24MN13]|nr:hypothetical protein VE04_01512 [Pseudogymnoascus sp. 24MN13]
MSDARKLPALLDFGADYGFSFHISFPVQQRQSTGYNPHPRVYHRHPSTTSKMHFHLATVLILIPLLTAAPTPKIVEREPVDVTDAVTGALGQLTGGLTKLPGGKRQAPDVAGTLKSAVDVVLGQGNEVNPKQLLGKRDSIDVTKALGEIFDPVNEALKKDYSKDFTPGGPKKPVGKRNDGIDVTKTVGELLSPFNDALKNSKDYAENYKTQDNTKTPSEQRGGGDGPRTVAAVLDQVTNAIENSKDFKPSGLETPSQALQRRADVLGGLLGMLTGGLGGGLKPPGSSKRDETTDAINSVPLAGPLMQLAQVLGGGALKDGKVPADFKFPDGTQVPPMAGAEKRLDVASAAKGVVYEVIDGVTKPTKNL